MAQLLTSLSLPPLTPTVEAPRRRFQLIITPYLRRIFLISFLISSLLMLIALVTYFRIQPEIPLFYTLALPEHQLARKEWLFLFPFLSFSISTGHLFIIHWCREYSPMLLKLFGWITLGLQVVLATSLVRILIII
jgi:hypothetical protein